METSDSPEVLPTGPRDGGRGRRQVSPVWWTSDDSSVVVSGLEDGLDDEPASRDDTKENKAAQQEQSVPTDSFDSSFYTAGSEPDRISFENRLRRQPSATCLSAQFVESGRCSNHESHEAGAVNEQTIRPTVATQDDTDRTNNRTLRSCQLAADMNQPELVKICSGSRRVSAQTATTVLETGMREDRDGSTGEQDAHKASAGIFQSTEDLRTRSSIASEESARVERVGIVAASLGPLQHFQAPNLSPQQAEFWNVHPSSTRHESLPLPFGQDLETPHSPSEEQKSPGCVKSFMAKLDSKVKAHTKAKRWSQGQGVMRAEVASRKAQGDHGARIAKISNSRHWREQLGPKEAPRYPDSKVPRRGAIPVHQDQSGHGNNRNQPSEQRQPLASRNPGGRPSGEDFELGEARAVRFSKPGKARLIDIPARKPKPFQIGSAEADLMASAGAMAKSARLPNMRTEDMRRRGAHSSAFDGATEAESLMRDGQPSRARLMAPAAGEDTASPYERHIRGSPKDQEQDARFRQLVRRLETTDAVSNRDAADTSVQELSRTSPAGASVPEQRSALSPANDRWCTGRLEPSILKHKNGYFGLNYNPRIPNNSDSDLASPSKIPAIPTHLPGDSGCPSLISDDGEEPCDLPEAVADEHPRAPTFQELPGISGSPKEEEDASASPNETSSDGSLTLVEISIDESELVSGGESDDLRAEETHANNIRTDNLRHVDFNEQRQVELGLERRRSDELWRYHHCAILRWLINTSDAPGAPGMRHESSDGLDMLMNMGDYQLRLGDQERANMMRRLRCLYERIPLPPAPDEEIQAFLESIGRH